MVIYNLTAVWPHLCFLPRHVFLVMFPDLENRLSEYSAVIPDRNYSRSYKNKTQHVINTLCFNMKQSQTTHTVIM